MKKYWRNLGRDTRLDAAAPVAGIAGPLVKVTADFVVALRQPELQPNQPVVEQTRTDVDWLALKTRLLILGTVAYDLPPRSGEKGAERASPERISATASAPVMGSICHLS